MPNGGHISCAYCVLTKDGICSVYGVSASPFALCRMFSPPGGMSRQEVHEHWPGLGSLAVGVVYSIDNDAFSAGNPQPVYAMRRIGPPPIPDSYWVIPGRLLAGEYPGALHENEARQKLRRMLAAGVTFFLDLTEEGELKPYSMVNPVVKTTDEQK